VRASTDSALAETDVNVKTSDGICDAVFIHPAKGAHPGVLIWPDSSGLRPVFRELGRRIAGEGYSVLVPNHLYRMARAPVTSRRYSEAAEADLLSFQKAIVEQC